MRSGKRRRASEVEAREDARTGGVRREGSEAMAAETASAEGGRLGARWLRRKRCGVRREEVEKGMRWERAGVVQRMRRRSVVIPAAVAAGASVIRDTPVYRGLTESQVTKVAYNTTVCTTQSHPVGAHRQARHARSTTKGTGGKEQAGPGRLFSWEGWPPRSRWRALSGDYSTSLTLAVLSLHRTTSSREGGVTWLSPSLRLRPLGGTWTGM